MRAARASPAAPSHGCRASLRAVSLRARRPIADGFGSTGCVLKRCSSRVVSSLRRFGQWGAGDIGDALAQRVCDDAVVLLADEQERVVPPRRAQLNVPHVDSAGV
jgi:hypothetical protein